MPEDEVLLKILEGIENCLRWGREYNLNTESGENQFAVKLQDKLQDLDYLKHQDGEIKIQIERILTDYFPTYESTFEAFEEENEENE